MKNKLKALITILMVSISSFCVADDTHKSDESNKIENWAMAYLMEHPDEKRRTAELIAAIEQGAIKTKDVEYFKNKPAGLRSIIATAILRLNTKLFLPLVTHEKQEWLCDSLIENSPTDGWYYPVLIYLPEGQKIGDILDYCITENKVGKWSAFVSSVEPNVNDSVKPVFEKIKEIIEKRK